MTIITQIQESIVEFGVARGRPYSESSIKIYISNFKNLHKWVVPKEEMTDLKWTKSTEKIKNALKEKKPNTRRNYYNSLIICMMASSENDAELIKHYEGVRDLLNADYDKTKHLPTESQDKVLKEVGKGEIYEMLEKMKTLIPGNRMEHMLYNIFRLHCHYPLRNELANIQVVSPEQYNNSEKKTNYIVVQKVGKGRRLIDHNLTLKLNDYKTSKRYGEKSIPIDDKKLKIDLLEWMTIGQKIDINKEAFDIPLYLFTWASGSPLTRGDLSTLMAKHSNKWLGHSVSTTLMAKIFSNVPKADGTKEEIKAAQKSADIRGHSLKVKSGIYTPDTKNGK